MSGAASRRKVCSVPECERTAHTKGMCSAHYHRLHRYGDPTAGFIPVGGPVHQHGSRGMYRTGCRCSPCRAANTAGEEARRRAKGIRTREELARWRSENPPVRIKRQRPSPEERFRGSYITDPSGCWLWQKAKNPGGYGVTWNGERTLGAHRYAYELLVGPIPEGLHLDHLCRVRACVNPAHLEPVTQAENNRRSNAIRWAS